MTRFFVCVAALTLVGIDAGQSKASPSLIFSKYGTTDPQNSWTYSEAVGVGKGNSSLYVPVQSDYVHANFIGYVQSDATGRWDTLPSNPAYYDEDMIRVFDTYVQSDKDSVLKLRLNGDDGHSVYVNDSYVGGGGFGVIIDFDLTLRAGVSTKLELAGYNGPGPWALMLGRQDNGLGISSINGLSINADGIFPQAVPEPPAFIMVATAALTLLGNSWRHRHASQKRL